jgi:hypothetical protein
MSTCQSLNKGEINMNNFMNRLKNLIGEKGYQDIDDLSETEKREFSADYFDSYGCALVIPASKNRTSYLRSHLYEGMSEANNYFEKDAWSSLAKIIWNDNIDNIKKIFDEIKEQLAKESL